MITTVKVGAPFPDVAHLGRALPLGSEVGFSSGDYRHRAPGVWTTQSQPVEESRLFTQLTLFKLGSGESEFTLPPETASQFGWRLRDTALAQAERSGISQRPVLAMVRDFGADKPLLYPGGLVSSLHDIHQLPLGSIIYAGHPDTPAKFGVWEVTEGGNLRHLLGARGRAPGQPMVIHSAPGLSAPTDPVAGPAELAQVALRAWRVGAIYRTRQSWCSVYDMSLESLCISKATLSSVGAMCFGPGDEVTRMQAALLPEGSLLWFRWERKAGFAVYLRDDRTRTKSRTRRLFGHYDDGLGGHERMTVIATPSEPMAWRLDGNVLRHCPDGTVFSDRHGEQHTLDHETRAMVERGYYYGYTVHSVVTQ